MTGEPVGRQDRLFYEFDLEEMVPGEVIDKLRATADAPAPHSDEEIEIQCFSIPRLFGETRFRPAH